MKDLFVDFNTPIVATIVSAVVAIVVTLLTHILGKFTLKYQERLKIATELSNKKFEGISKIRDEINILSMYENLSITEPKNSLIPEFVGGKVYTPVACYSFEKLSTFTAALNDLHSTYGHCLNHTCVINLIYMRNFFLDYCTKCAQLGYTDEVLRWASVPLYESFQSWYKMLDKDLIKALNKPSTRYYSHSGLIYNYLLKRYGRTFSKSFPIEYMSNIENLPPEAMNDDVQ